MTMAISEHFFHTKPSIGQRFVFMLRKGTDFFEESVEKSWGKNQLMKAVRSSSHVLIVPSLSSFSHVFASPVSDRGNIADYEKFMNVFMRIGIVITEPGVGATTRSAAHMGSSSIGS
ncbi:hypothetical protein Tco_0638585 [Tanacetum coccineum]